MLRMERASFAEVFRRALDRNPVKQGVLAQAIGKTQPYVSHLLNERDGKKPTPEIAEALAVALGANVDEFLLAAGFAPKNVEGKRPSFEVITGLGRDSRYPPTPEEDAIIDAALPFDALPSTLYTPAFWERPPAKRRKTMLAVQLLVEELASEAQEGNA